MAQQVSAALGLTTSGMGASGAMNDLIRLPDLKALEHGAQALLATVQPNQHDVPMVERSQLQLNRDLREFLKDRSDDEQFAKAQLHFAKYGVNLTDSDRRLASIVSQYETFRSNQLLTGSGDAERPSIEAERRISFENASTIFKRNLESTLQFTWESAMRRAEAETVYELAKVAKTDWDSTARRILNAIAIDSFATSSTRLRDTTVNQSVQDFPKYSAPMTQGEVQLFEVIRAINNEAAVRGSTDAAKSTFNFQAAFKLIDTLGEIPRLSNDTNAQTAFANRQLTEAITVCRTLLRELLSNPTVREDLMRNSVTEANRDDEAETSIEEKSEQVLTYRTSNRFERAFRLISLKHLEENYATHVRTCVFADAETVRAAQLGGVPSTRSLVRAFIQIRLRHFLSRQSASNSHGYLNWTSQSANLDDGPFEDGLVEGQPIWMMLYILVRVGSYRDAADLAKTHFQDTRFAEIASLIAEFGETRTLSSPSRERIVSMHNAASSSRRLSAQLNLTRSDTQASMRDPFKRLLLSLIGAVNLEEQHSEVAETIEDHIWMRLTQISVLDGGESNTTPSSGRPLALDGFQSLLSNQLGESYFNANENPMLFFRVLMLTAQFEAACALLARFDNLRAIAVHLAIALRSAGLLITSEPDIHVGLLSSVRDSAMKRLNYSRLILTYAKRFERVDAQSAIEYYYLLRDMLVPIGSGTGAITSLASDKSQYISVFVQTVAELVLETHQFELIVGRIQPGTNVRTPGLIDRFTSSATETVIAEIAAHAEQSGRIEDAILLFDLARDFDSVVALLVRALSMTLAAASRMSLRERDEVETSSTVTDASSSERRRVVRLAVDIAQRYSAQAVATDRALTHTFYMLIDIHTFFEQFLAGNYDLAYNTISALEILPTTNEQIDMRVAQFRTFADELQCVIPDLLLSCMLLLYRRARALRASLSGSATSVQQAALTHVHAAGVADSVRRIQSEATVLLKFAGSLLPFRLSHDVTSRLDQLEMRISSLLD